MPVITPRRQRRRKHGALHSARCRSQHAQIALMLQIQVQPRLPAFNQARLHHALRRFLHEMRHKRLVRSLSLLSQGLRVLLLLGKSA
eukprot:scaffold7860_cov57-Phaeocystis_antarctica.AAC.1